MIESQFRNLSGIVGLTIASVEDFTQDKIGFRFTDNSMLVLAANMFDGAAEFETLDELENHELYALGAIDQQEYDRREQIYKAELRERELARERKEYERLKAKFLDT